MKIYFRLDANVAHTVWVWIQIQEYICIFQMEFSQQNDSMTSVKISKYQKISMHLIKTTMSEPKSAEVRCSLGIILEQLALLLLVLRSPVVSSCCDGKLLFFPHAVSLYICDLFYTVGSLHRQAWTYLHIPHTEKCAAVLAWH